MTRSSDWQAIAAQQGGVLARRQALRNGMSEDAWQWKLDLGLWTPVLPGVVATHSGDPTRRQLHRAAVLKAGEGAALAGDAALLEVGFPFKDLDVVDVAVGDRPAGKSLPLGNELVYRPHSVRGLSRMLTELDGMPTMTCAFAVLMAAAWAPSDRAAEWRLATAVQRDLAAPDELRSALVGLPKLRRRDLVSTVLDDVELGAHAMSELDFLRVCRRFRVPVPDELQVKVRAGGRTRYLDGRYRRQGVRFEVDGAHHRTVEGWEADAQRGNDIAIATRGAGEIQLRFTGSQVRHQGHEVARQLRAALRC